MAVDLEIFDILDGPMTIDQLQQKTRADRVLLRGSHRFWWLFRHRLTYSRTHHANAGC